jgi:hypothetical protein
MRLIQAFFPKNVFTGRSTPGAFFGFPISAEENEDAGNRGG